MGKFNNQLKYAIDRIQELKVPDNKTSKEDLQKHNQPIYQEVLGIIDKHIESELHEEKDIGRLIDSLQNYRKHLKFARIVLDKDFACQPSGKDLDSMKITCTPPDIAKDMVNAQKQIALAQKEWENCKKIIADVLKEGKLKLE